MRKLDRDQAAVIGAFTGVLCGPFSDLHEYVEKVMRCSVMTHEMGDKTVADEIKEAARADFIALLPSSVPNFANDPSDHVIEFSDNGWSIQHPLVCRPNLLNCEVYKTVSAFERGHADASMPPGRYHITFEQDEPVYVPVYVLLSGSNIYA